MSAINPELHVWEIEMWDGAGGADAMEVVTVAAISAERAAKKADDEHSWLVVKDMRHCVAVSFVDEGSGWRRRDPAE